MSKKLLTLSFLFVLTANLWGAKSDPIPSGTEAGSRVLPFTTVSANSTSSLYYPVYTSFSQAIYTKAELGASAQEITAIEYFISSGSGSATTRTLQVWIKEVDNNSFEINPSDACFYLIYDEVGTPKQYLPGTKVFSGSVTIPVSGSYTITFDNSFNWSGNKNICVTVADITGTDCSNHSIRHTIIKTDSPRFNYRFSNSSSSSNWYWIYNNSLDFWGLKGASLLKGMQWSTPATVEGQTANCSYAPKAAFTFGAAVLTPPATPSGLTASNVGVSTASLAWSAVGNATSYKLYYSVDNDVYIELATPSTNSYEWSGLTASTTYFLKVAAVNGAGSSALSDPISFTTLAPHIHDGITFEPWFNPSTLPTSGNYYINSNMNFEAYAADAITLTGNLNLCLNGKTVNMESSNIIVPSGKTLTIYDNVGGGKLTSFFGAQVGWTEAGSSAFIKVEEGGTLVLKEGTIENTYNVDDEYFSYAIYSNGTLRIAGAPIINSNDVDIYLSTTGLISLDGPITSSEAYTVNKYSGSLATSGWSTHMGSAKPSSYLTHVDASKGFYLNEGEVYVIKELTFADTYDMSSLDNSELDQLRNVIICRSFTSASFNSICLPFALSDAQLQEVFGAGYDLEEFTSSDLDGEELVLTFTSRNALVAGKPYLIQPSVSVSIPEFTAVTITTKSVSNITGDDFVECKGTFAPTALDNGNENILFLGADNTLYWPSSSSGDIKGFRAYFEVKGDARKTAKRARIGKQTDDATAIETITNDQSPITNKVIENGLIIILRDGKTYNVMGQIVK